MKISLNTYERSGAVRATYSVETDNLLYGDIEDVLELASADNENVFEMMKYIIMSMLEIDEEEARRVKPRELMEFVSSLTAAIASYAEK